MTWKVTLEATATVYTTVIVDADGEEEAGAKALAAVKAKENDAWETDFPQDVEDVEVWLVEEKPARNHL